MRTTKSHLCYFDYLGNVLDAWGKTGGQQGDPLEMIVFCLTVHHLWGRTLNKHHPDVCAVAYANDSYIKAKLSVALEVLSDIKHVLKEDAGLALNLDKTKILVKGLSAADAHAAAQRMLAADPSLAHLSPLLSPASFVVDGYIGLGVPIGLMRLSSILSRISVRQLWRTSTSSTTSRMASSTTSSFGFAKLPALST